MINLILKVGPKPALREPINHSIRQSINHSIRQPINHSIRQPISHLPKQISHSVIFKITIWSSKL